MCNSLLDVCVIFFLIQFSFGLHEVFIGSHSHHMYALVAETGALLWKTKLGDRIESSACVSLCGKYIIVGKEKLQSQIGTFIYNIT